MQDPRGDQVQDELVLAHHHGMAGIVAALVPRDYVRPLREQINDLPFAFIAPLGPDYD
jgi:hypothetical protein